MRFAILLTAALLAATSAAAQMPAPAAQDRSAARAALHQACAADAARFCPGVQAGGGRLSQCFKGHRAELSEACRSAIISVRQARAAAGVTPH